VATTISGKEVSKYFRGKIKEETARIFEKTGKKPGIACILTGEDPASQIYVRNKEKTAIKLGFNSVILKLPQETTEKELISKVEELNRDSAIDGILVQMPLPHHINEQKVINTISPSKDVDVFHPQNTGALWSGHGELAPCTPLGIIRLLEYYKIPIDGKRAVIVGRSNIVGKPLACLLLRRHATVTICHSRTKNLSQICREADILVAAIGKSEFITKDFVKPGAILIDVGMNRSVEGRLTGDFLYDEVKDTAGAITPVPGGVGPMTIAMLMYNTLFLHKEHNRDD